MTFKNDVIDAIGNTPLIALKRASEATGCTILGKAEFINPGGSVKDRAARQMILEAERRGELRPGGLVVESTAGNTGIGLALVASARGYRTLIVIPETQSQEKKDVLRLCGAELIEVPAVPFSDPNNYQHIGRRLADQLRASEPNGVLFADQWNNLDNREAHILTTGPEIWQQTGGKVDGFICSIGTGGTLAGIARSARAAQRHRDRRCRSPWARRCTTCSPWRGEGDPTAARSRRASALAGSPPMIADLEVDEAYLIPDEEAVPIIFDLLSTKGSAWAARPASMSPARSGWPASSARATPS